MSKITIRTRSGVYAGELDRSDISNWIWLSLPFRADINMLGSMIYFEMPTGIEVKGDRTVFEKGDIAYWPEANAMCLLFGPTPLSGKDGKPVSPYPMKRIGRITDECGSMEQAGDRTRITIER